MIDWSKPIQTKAGNPAKLVHTLTGTVYRRVVVIRYPKGEEEIRITDDNGIHCHGNLENIPVMIQGYMGVYRSADGYFPGWIHKTPDSITRTPTLKAILKIDIPEGEGL